eukprot:6410159-Prymnesium_polylepis.1
MSYEPRAQRATQTRDTTRNILTCHDHSTHATGADPGTGRHSSRFAHSNRNIRTSSSRRRRRARVLDRLPGERCDRFAQPFLGYPDDDRRQC